jgi:glycosyltransferase involved in cell wall biosynthesis
VPKRIIWDQFQLPILSLKYKLDICHCLTDILPITGKGKFVLCVIEIPDYRIELADKNRHSSLYTRLSRRYNMFLFRSSLKKASVIIVSSNSTKEDLIKRYNVDAKKISVLYLAAEECFCVNDDEKELFNTRKKYKSEIGYILHISSSDPRDNTPVVIRAYQKALGKLNVPKKLVIAGNVDAEEKELRELITELNLKDNIIFTGYLPRQELVSLYQAADLFIGPSLFEGFGLQVVEAMACGIPIITSNVTALPEIVGNAGILVAPTDTHRLASALVEILNNSRLTQMMRQNSLERAKFFLWDRTARDTLDIYNSLLGKEKPLF